MLKRMLFFAYGVACYLVFLGDLPLRHRLRRRLPACRAASTARSPAASRRAIAINCGLLDDLRRPAQRDGAALVQGALDAGHPVVHRALHLRAAASLALLLLFWQWRPIGIEIWNVENRLGRAVLWTLFGAGWAHVLVVTFLINHFDLFGLRQVWLPLVGKPYTPVAFRTPLPYRLVRHPLYFGFLSRSGRRRT